MSPIGSQNKQDKRNEQEEVNQNNTKNQQFIRRTTNEQTSVRCKTFKRAQAILKKGRTSDLNQSQSDFVKYPIVKDNTTNMKVMQQSQINFQILKHAKTSPMRPEAKIHQDHLENVKNAREQYKIVTYAGDRCRRKTQLGCVGVGGLFVGGYQIVS